MGIPKLWFLLYLGIPKESPGWWMVLYPTFFCWSAASFFKDDMLELEAFSCRMGGAEIENSKEFNGISTQLPECIYIYIFTYHFFPVT